MVLVEQQYKEVRRKLDEMGYHQPCSVESLLLVDKLLKDLICLREKNLLCEEMSSDTLKKYERMENYLEANKKENNRLLKENNKLHLEAIIYKEDSEKKMKEFKMRISELESIYSDLEFNYMEQMTNLGTLRQELIDKTNKLHEFGMLDKDNVEMKDGNNSTKRLGCRDYMNFDTTQNTNEEIENYKKKQRQMLHEIESLENQVHARDREIARLVHQLEERNYVQIDTLEKDQNRCSCHLINSCPPQKVIATTEMYERIKASQDKQHEAMQRAIILADRIQELEFELLELKKKNTSSNYCTCGTNITMLKKQHEETYSKIKDMEMRMTNLQGLINNLTKEKDEGKEKILLLEKEKDSLYNKITNFKSIEKDLMLEIDRLQQNNADLKNDIAHLHEKNIELLDAIEKAASNANANRSPMNITNGTSNSKSCDNLCEKIKAERDYYCNELHRLQEKVFSVERIHEIQCCRHSENERDIIQIQRMKCDLQLANEENRHLQEQIVSLRNQLKQVSSYKNDSNKMIESHIKKLEYDKGVLVSANNNLKSKVRSIEQNMEELNKVVSDQAEEVKNYKIKYNHLKKLNMHLELSLKNSEASIKRADVELNQAITSMNVLEKELKRVKDENAAVRKEKQEVRENLLRLDSEKDEVLLKIDEKTILLSNLEKELQRKSAQLTQTENKKCELQTEVQTLERMLQEAQDKCREYLRSNRKLEQEIVSCQSFKENLQMENQTLKRELAAVSQDIILTNQALDKSRQESEDLKRELQTYVDEVRRVEKILQEKEREREALLEQFNALSAEATHLECTQQSLEYEANLSKDNLRDTQEKLYALQKDATAKQSMVSLMENQVRELSDQVVQLQAKISEMGDRELILSTDLEAARNLCSTLEEQKQYFNMQLSQMGSSEKALRDELDRLECENETLHTQLSHEQKSSFALEDMLTSTRHDTVEKSIFNDNLTKEVNKMKETVASLETKLNSVKSALSDCQSTCADYHTQNIMLKRQLTNEKFEKAKDLDSNSTSL